MPGSTVKTIPSSTTPLPGRCGRVLVHVEPDAVPQAVPKILAVTLGGDVVARLGVHFTEADAGPDRLDGELLRHPDRFVHLALPALRLAQADRHRLVRAVTPVKCAVINRDQLAGRDDLVRGLAMRSAPRTPELR